MIKKSLVMVGLFSVLLGACTPTTTPTIEIKTQEAEEVQPSVAVVNPENTENILLVTVNGVVMYDEANEALGN